MNNAGTLLLILAVIVGIINSLFGGAAVADDHRCHLRSVCIGLVGYNNEENRHIVLVTEKGTFTYGVFSVYEEKASDYPIQTEFSNDNEYLKFLNK